MITGINHCHKDYLVKVLRDTPLSSSFPMISKWINENNKWWIFLIYLPLACYPSASLSHSLLIQRGILFQFYSCNSGIRFVEYTLFLLGFCALVAKGIKPIVVSVKHTLLLTESYRPFPKDLRGSQSSFYVLRENEQFLSFSVGDRESKMILYSWDWQMFGFILKLWCQMNFIFLSLIETILRIFDVLMRLNSRKLKKRINNKINKDEQCMNHCLLEIHYVYIQTAETWGTQIVHKLHMLTFWIAFLYYR